MSSYKIDTDTGDLVYENGDHVRVSGIDEIEQKIRLKLGLVQGEWFFDRTKGVPYYSKIWIKTKADPVTVDSVFVQTILSVSGVQSLAEPIDYTLNKQNRVLGLSFKAKTEFGILEMEFTP